MYGEFNAELLQLFMSRELSEGVGNLSSANNGLAQRHGRVSSALHGWAGPPDAAHHVLDDIGADERTTKCQRQAEANDGEQFFGPFENTGANTGGDLFEVAEEITEQFLSVASIRELPCLMQNGADRGVQRRGQPADSVPGFMSLAGLDRRVAAETPADRLGPVNDEQGGRLDIEFTGDQIVGQNAWMLDERVRTSLRSAARTEIGGVPLAGPHQSGSGLCAS